VRGNSPNIKDGYAAASGCGANTAAGRDGNRTSFSDSKDGGTPTTVAYCYDWADRLTATTVTNAPVGASPVAGANLTTIGTPTLVYDSHGNTTTLGNQTMVYDVADRHIATTVVDAGGTSTVTYVRDASDRIVSRTSTPPSGPATTTRYLYAGGSLFGTDSGAGTAVERDVSLPGGVSVRLPAGSPPVPELPPHGHIRTCMGIPSCRLMLPGRELVWLQATIRSGNRSTRARAILARP